MSNQAFASSMSDAERARLSKPKPSKQLLMMSKSEFLHGKPTIDTALNDELLQAVNAGSVNRVRSLFAGKRIPYVNLRSKNDNTPLIIATLQDNVEIAQLLIRAKAELNATNKEGQTALIIAVLEGKPNVLKLLIDANANLNTQDNHNFTALMWASIKGQLNTVRALVDAGANLDIQDKDGNTALIRAVVRGYKDIVKLLIASGAHDYNKTAISYSSPQNKAAIQEALEMGEKEHSALLIKQKEKLQEQEETAANFVPSIIYTKHAKKRMEERKIGKKEVENVVWNGITLREPEDDSDIILYKTEENEDGTKQLVVVAKLVKRNNIKIITTYYQGDETEEDLKLRRKK